MRNKSNVANRTSIQSVNYAELFAYGSFNTNTKDALRAVLEFAIPNDLDAADIQSAKLRFGSGTSSGGGSSAFEVFGYSGNGAVEVVDALQNSNRIGAILMFSRGEVDIPLSPKAYSTHPPIWDSWFGAITAKALFLRLRRPT